MTRNPVPHLAGYELHRLLRHDEEGETWLARRAEGQGQAPAVMLETGASQRHFVTRLIWSVGLSHLNVLPLIHHDLADGSLTERHQRRNHFGVWAWPEGPSLARVGRRARAAGRRWPVGVVAKIGLAVARAVHHLHQVHEMPHGELDRSRIFLSPSGEVRVCGFAGDPRDFGIRLAKARYFSPEHVRGRALRPHSNVFSLGLLLYELATGRRQLHTQSLERLVGSVLAPKRPSPSDVEPTLPWSFDRVIDRAVALEQSERHQSMAELVAALEALVMVLEAQGESCDVGAFVREVSAPDLRRMQAWMRLMQR